MQKRRVSIGVWLIVLLVIGMVYLFWGQNSFSTIEKRIRDLFFMMHIEKKPLDQVIIVDIDERSLQGLGQWPWERDTVSRLIETLAQSGASVIGLDIIFAEEDKTSPLYINKKLHLGLKNPLDYDTLLAQTFTKTPTVAGYMFDMEDTFSKGTISQSSAVILERGDSQQSIPEAQGITTNISLLQESVSASGHFNIFPDEDGIIRSAPLLIRYQEMLYPSLALEVVRHVMGERRIGVTYSSIGVQSIEIGNRKIPTDRHGNMAISYRGRSHTFPYVSAVDVLHHQTNKHQFQDKIVLIGSSAKGLLDLRATPLESTIAGVEIHANIIDNILKGDFLSAPDWVEGFDLVIFLSLFTLLYILFLRLHSVATFIVALLALCGIYYGIVWILFVQGILIHTLLPFMALGMALGMAIFINYFYETKQRKYIRSIFDRKVSSSVVEELLRHEHLLQSREGEVTVMFSDIRSFTTIAEQIDSPQKLIALLNDYITPMTEIILAHQGTLDKFMGDGIMAYWNAPRPIEGHADMAVLVALLQQESLTKLNMELKKKYGVELQIGIGINTGRATIGEIGSAGRSDYTIIGDSVNVASRVEQLNKKYKTGVLITESTRKALKGSYEINEIGSENIRGKEEIIQIFEVIAKL